MSQTCLSITSCLTSYFIHWLSKLIFLSLFMYRYYQPEKPQNVFHWESIPSLIIFIWFLVSSFFFTRKSNVENAFIFSMTALIDWAERIWWRQTECIQYWCARTVRPFSACSYSLPKFFVETTYNPFFLKTNDPNRFKFG